MSYNKLNKSKKPKRYIQKSQIFIFILLILLLSIVIYAMIMGVVLRSTNIVIYLVTSIAATALGATIWYMKNSESEKKARFQYMIERDKLSGKVNTDYSGDPDTFYTDSSDTQNIDKPAEPDISYCDDTPRESSDTDNTDGVG